MFHVGFVTNISLHYRSSSKLHAFNMSMGNSKFNVSDAKILFFPSFYELKTWLEYTTTGGILFAVILAGVFAQHF